ncbi:MAG: polysaccharide pyruvyl transferase family protein [Kiritimatiellae bacterium]|nr:polysaccharide pyruvyl transferase family protein [Kiritimatiellia bacterium]
MRIAILTYYEIANYGTLLQAYGLWKYLEKRGHDVEFLDEPYGRSMFPYVPPRIRNFVSRHPLSAWKNVFRNYSAHTVTYFNEMYPRTRYFSSYEDMVENFHGYDAVVIGSDLVWHPQWCSPKFTNIAFLGFVPEACKRVSISPSFSATTWNAPDKDRAGDLLRGFDAIGVREASGRDVVEDMSGRADAEVLIDSAMLLRGADYAQLFDKSEGSGPYIFNYLLGWSNGSNEEKLLEVVKSALRVDLVKNQYESNRGLFSRILRTPARITVKEWLQRISGAKFVLTNSFHGTVFSILFHRPFATMLINGKMSCLNERVISLLTLLGLESRMVFNNESDKLRAVVYESVNWDLVDERLDNERRKVAQFLMKVCL